MLRKLAGLLLLSLTGCWPDDPHPTPPAPPPTLPERYRLTATPSEKFAGSPGWMRIIEVRDTRTNRLWVVLQSTGASNPPAVGDLSASLVVLSTSTEGHVK